MGANSSSITLPTCDWHNTPYWKLADYIAGWLHQNVHMLLLLTINLDDSGCIFNSWENQA